MNYIGSKLSLLPFLDECITSVVGEMELPKMTFCDLFAGTGAVGKHFKDRGCRILSNDIQYYSYALNQHYIGNHRWMPFKGLEDEVSALAHLPIGRKRQEVVCTYLASLGGIKGFIYHNYSQGDALQEEGARLYFSRRNAMQCDAIRTKIEEWHNWHSITKEEYFFLLTTLLEAIDKVANTTSVYGAYLKTLKKSAQKTLELEPARTIINEQEHRIYKMDANELIKEISADILYLDPPYNQRQYATNYHLLETIALYDSPVIYGKTGIREYATQKSRYCSKRDVVQAFEELILNARTRYIFLSYNNEGLLSSNQIQEIMGQRGEYGCFTREHSRFKADKASKNRKIKANCTTEYLHYVVVD